MRNFVFHEVVFGTPGSACLRYLELGYGSGHSFERLVAPDKQSVDIAHSEATHFMSTDQFFNSFSGKPFDIIYIDAGHDWQNVLRDWNNSLKNIVPEGLIFAHDLIPPDFAHTGGHLCSDGYKFYATALKSPGFELFSYTGDFGLTIFTAGVPVRENDIDPDLSYENFIRGLDPDRLTPDFQAFTEYARERVSALVEKKLGAQKEEAVRQITERRKRSYSPKMGPVRSRSQI